MLGDGDLRGDARGGAVRGGRHPRPRPRPGGRQTLQEGHREGIPPSFPPFSHHLSVHSSNEQSMTKPKGERGRWSSARANFLLCILNHGVEREAESRQAVRNSAILKPLFWSRAESSAAGEMAFGSCRAALEMSPSSHTFFPGPLRKEALESPCAQLSSFQISLREGSSSSLDVSASPAKSPS